jgi:predicted outer membrane repeat protein
MIRTWQSSLSELGLGKRRRAGNRHSRVWSPEGLEDRVLLSGLTYTVDRLTDTGAGSGTSGDLRYTMIQADANPGSTIQFGVTGTIALSSALPIVNADLTIAGPGASNLSVQGTSASRVFEVDSATVTISGLTIADGIAPSGGSSNGGGLYSNHGTLTVTACTFTGDSANIGGAIDNFGILTVNDSTFANNTATAEGAAIQNDGTTTVTDCTFSNNSANNFGGAIFSDLFLTVSGCTFSGNSVGAIGRGGAIMNYFATSTISNSTFVNNSAVLGGALDSYYSSASHGASHAFATLTDVTITGSAGGGIDNEGDTVGDLTLVNSVIAGNTGGDVVGLVNGIGSKNNLIGDGSQEAGIGNGSSGNQVGTTQNPINAKLGTLASNGGPTQTVALLPGSPALGGGNGTTTTDTDQRGVPRGQVLDIGAYQATATQLAVNGFPSPTAPGAPHAFTVSAVDSFGQTALDFSGPLTFSSSDQAAVLPTGQALVAGQASVSATLNTSGIQSITASAGGLSGSQNAINVSGTPATATFLKKDSTSQGNWIGTYGSDGYEVVANATKLPSYATVTPSGQSVVTWTANTTDARALQQAGGSGRIAAAWYSSTGFTINVNVTDGKSHNLELYFLDWDSTGRAEKVQITDATSGTVLDTETITSFHSGAYLDWAVSGNILVKITKTGGANAVLSGLFFDSGAPIKLTPTITWTNPADIVYGTALSSTQLDASANVAGTFAYTPASGTVLSAGKGQSLSVTFTPTDTTDYSIATASALINVLQATPTITWANPADIVAGTALSSTQLDATSSWTVGGVAGSVAGTFNYTPAAGTILAAGSSQALSVTFTPTDTTDYTSANGSATIDVTPASSSATFLKRDTTTEGNWIGAYGADGYEVIANATKLPSYATVTPSGQSVVSWTANTTDARALQQAGGSGRIAAGWYSSTGFTVNVNITDGNTHDLELYFLDWDTTARAEKVQITNATSGTILDTETITSFHSGAYLNWSISGNVAIKITKTAGANAVLSGLFFDSTSATKTTPTISWANPADIVYGTALSSTQLDASANVAGTFAYTPASGTVLSAGKGQSLSVTFTPTDTTDYSIATASALINVLQATPTITWANPADIVAGTALSSTQLDATSSWTVGGVAGSVAGTFNYTPAAGTILAAGSSQALSVTFTPTDTTDYTSANGSATIDVTPASSSATFLKRDTTTEGNWIGAYGADGYEVIANATKLPSYATVTPSGQSVVSWTANTTDARALQQAGGSGRIAAGWYSSTGFTVNVNITDGNTHDLELYFLDWDTTARAEKVQITNATSGTILDTETITSFHSGAYLNWAISGNVVIKITKTGGANAVLSGLFFDGALGTTSAPAFATAPAAAVASANVSIPSALPGTSHASPLTFDLALEHVAQRAGVAPPVTDFALGGIAMSAIDAMMIEGSFPSMIRKGHGRQ